MVTHLDLRREARGHVIMPGAIRHNVTCRAEVAVTDLSARGCRIISSGQDLVLGSALFVRLDQLAPLRATVRWDEAGIIGLEFDRPLYIPVMDHLLIRWPAPLTPELAAI